MKTILITLLFSNIALAQVAIGKTTVTPDAILEFANEPTNTKGIILPNVTDASTMTNVTPGTIVFDRASAKIKYNDGFWQELTDFPGTSGTLLPGNDNPNAKVIIGDQTSSADGVLVLDSPNKALILPHIIDPVTNVKSPIAGMICYDPVKKMMCVFNGQKWFFWE